jgi:FixJ family two-component response regulator
MTDAPAVVFVVDDDESVRRALERLLRAAGHRVEVFTSVPEFLARPEHEGPRCLVLDVRMPGQTGLELHRRLEAAGRDLPVIFITGHADVSVAVHAMKAGAIDFLAKPFEDAELLDATGQALERDRKRWESSQAFGDRS